MVLTGETGYLQKAGKYADVTVKNNALYIRARRRQPEHAKPRIVAPVVDPGARRVVEAGGDPSTRQVVGAGGDLSGLGAARGDPGIEPVANAGGDPMPLQHLEPFDQDMGHLNVLRLRRHVA